MSDFARYTADLVERARAAGWEVLQEKAIPYGRQFHVGRGGAKAVLSCYHGKKGFSFVPGGKAGSELADSKGLSDGAIERIAGQLEERGQGEVEVLMPREYNPRYAEVRNINILLSQMHGTCLRRLHERTGPVEVVIVDQFARRTDVMEREARLPAGCRLVTRTKGEADPAVAAASILARAAFVRGLRELGHEFGMTIPPGAGAPVLKAGRTFVETFGREALRDVAKLHFATSNKL